MERLATAWNETIDRASGRNQAWRRDVRTAVVLSILDDCVSHGILDSTRSKSFTQANMATKLMVSSIQSAPRLTELGRDICKENHVQIWTSRVG
jgi:hypothetical protein